MKISLLCNAGLALQYDGQVLLIDAINGEAEPFCALSDDLWQKILLGEKPFDNVVALSFTHCHRDHYDESKIRRYMQMHPDVPVLLPGEKSSQGKIVIGAFEICYKLMPHAPMSEETPPHVVAAISAGERSVYISGDALLDVNLHREFLNGRKMDVAFWNSMYLSREETRKLMQETAKMNCIYHMPFEKPDAYGLWKKCLSNYRRYPEELKNVTVLNRYPMEIEV